jgi:amidase
MTRTVADTAALLTVLAGVDAADPATRAGKGKADADYTRFLDQDGLKGARIGVARAKLFGLSPEADRLTEAAIEVLRTRGAAIVDPADIPHLDEYGDAEQEVLLYEFKTDLEAYLAAWAPGGPRTLADLMAFNEARRGEELPYFGQERFAQAAAKGPLTDKAYKAALEKSQRLSRREGLDAVFARHRLDAILAPTGSPTWVIDLVNGDNFVMSSAAPAAVAGYPAITVPAGQAWGLPVGVTFIGRPWSEGTLLKLAYAYEQASRLRRPPRFLPTADLSGR